MTETNPFLPFIPEQAHTLVLGSFPCLFRGSYGEWFYSGSGKNLFWPILSELSGLPAGNLEEKKAVCRHLKIALCDTALRIRRRKNNCSDANLEIVELYRDGVLRCLEAGVRRVFHTSRFVERNFRKIAGDVLLPQSVLVSPSPTANRYIGGLPEYRELLDQKRIDGPYGYRVLKYAEAFGTGRPA